MDVIGQYYCWALLTVFQYTTVDAVVGNQNQCLAIVTPDFNDCGNLRHPAHTSTLCSETEMCKKQFKITKLNIDPFSDILTDIMSNVVENCCGSCRNLSEYETVTVDLDSLSRNRMNRSNFIFPVLGLHTEHHIYGYHYIPLLEVSSGYYVTRAQTHQQVMLRLINSCANLWPLLVIILMLALIAGFIVWISETWWNRNEFTRTFVPGLFDGFWWSFVSMTTVGYGDKTPKFFVSRLFSIVWILIGITICSLFTASLTTEISSASNPTDPDMHGKKVGVLRHRTFDAAFVAKHGGTIQEADNVMELKHMLSTTDIGGIFLDKFTYMHTVSRAKGIKEDKDEYSNRTKAAKFFLEDTTIVKHPFQGDRMSYGVLVREREDFHFFVGFMKHNQAVYETCSLFTINEIDSRPEGEHNLFSTESGYFHPFLYGAIGAICVIVVFGIIFEFFRKRKIVMKSKEGEEA